jgi:hypothetical protein
MATAKPIRQAGRCPRALFIMPALALTLAACQGQTRRELPGPAAAEVTPTAAWPTTISAQHRFAGEQMFVETRGGRRTAWVLSAPETPTAQALDFFSGAIVPARPAMDAEGRPLAEFSDAAGRRHAQGDARGYRFKDPRPGGSLPLGDNGFVVFSAETIRFEQTSAACLPPLSVVQRKAEMSPTPRVLWRKVMLYRSSPSPGCPRGAWDTIIRSALDLDDGTMLVATSTALVARLHKADLRPVGAAPDLRIVDAAALETLAYRASTQPPSQRETAIYDALDALFTQEPGK